VRHPILLILNLELIVRVVSPGRLGRRSRRSRRASLTSLSRPLFQHHLRPLSGSCRCLVRRERALDSSRVHDAKWRLAHSLNVMLVQVLTVLTHANVLCRTCSEWATHWPFATCSIVPFQRASRPGTGRLHLGDDRSVSPNIVTGDLRGWCF
jgi:hypothetical protein